MIVTTINFMALAYGKLMKIGLVIFLNLNKVNYHKIQRTPMSSHRV